MENGQRINKAIERGVFWGLIYLILIIPSMIVSFVAQWYPQGFVIKILSLVVSLGSLIAGILLYVGIWALGKKRRDQVLTKHLKVWFVLGATFLVWILLTSSNTILSSSIKLPLTFALIPLVISMGVFLILLGKDFKRLESDFGKPATRAASWNKISGWLMVIVLLSPIGALLSVIADYYMWRVLQEEVKRHGTKK